MQMAAGQSAASFSDQQASWNTDIMCTKFFFQEANKHELLKYHSTLL